MPTYVPSRPVSRGEKQAGCPPPSMSVQQPDLFTEVEQMNEPTSLWELMGLWMVGEIDERPDTQTENDPRLPESG